MNNKPNNPKSDGELTYDEKVERLLFEAKNKLYEGVSPDRRRELEKAADSFNKAMRQGRNGTSN